MFMYLNRLKMIIKYSRGSKILVDSTGQVFFLRRKQDFSYFCCIPCIIDSCMEEVTKGVKYNTLLDSNEGELSPHTS